MARQANIHRPPHRRKNAAPTHGHAPALPCGANASSGQFHLTTFDRAGSQESRGVVWFDKKSGMLEFGASNARFRHRRAEVMGPGTPRSAAVKLHCPQWHRHRPAPEGKRSATSFIIARHTSVVAQPGLRLPGNRASVRPAVACDRAAVHAGAGRESSAGRPHCPRALRESA